MSFRRIILLILLFWCISLWSVTPAFVQHRACMQRSGRREHETPPLCIDSSHSDMEHPDADISFPTISFPILCDIKQVRATLLWHCQIMTGNLTWAIFWSVISDLLFCSSDKQKFKEMGTELHGLLSCQRRQSLLQCLTLPGIPGSMQMCILLKCETGLKWYSQFPY